MKHRIIMHIDMNSYFASCEQQDRPEWRGKPVGVCEHLGGIIIAPSVEAKRWGIKTGTPVWEARQLYPKIFLTPTNPARYRKYTARFLKVFADYTDKIEKYSIDEAFLDLTDACVIKRPNQDGDLVNVDPWQEAQRISEEIKRRMKIEVGDWIRCSVGVGSSKLLAKIGSDLQKPDGLTVITPENKHMLYDRLELMDIPGIGWRMNKRLRDLGITKLVHLRDYPVSKLVAKYGIMGYHLHSMGQLEGSFKENFNTVEDPLKSIGHMYTLPKDYRKSEYLQPVMFKLCEMVASRLRLNSLMGRSVHIHIHTGHKTKCLSTGRKVSSLLQNGREIFAESLNLLAQLNPNWQTLQPYLIGVTCAGLVNAQEQQSLITKDYKVQRLDLALDQINAKYEDFTVARTPAFLAKDIIRDSIGFGRMKEFTTSQVRGSHGKFG